jgi:hypothetical protein
MNKGNLAQNTRPVGFYRHRFQPRFETLDLLPRVLITKSAYYKMAHYVDIAPMEVGWLGTAEKLGNDFLISDVFLFVQQVHLSTTEITEAGLAEFATEILEKQGDQGVITLNNLRFWGHSHHTMNTIPSPQDDDQMLLFAQADQPWFIRGIFNKQGEASITLYLYDQGLKIVDMEWEIYEPIDLAIREEIEAEFTEKVSVMTLPAITVHSRSVSRLKGIVPHTGQYPLPEINEAPEYDSEIALDTEYLTEVNPTPHTYRRKTR